MQILMATPAVASKRLLEGGNTIASCIGCPHRGHDIGVLPAERLALKHPRSHRLAVCTYSVSAGERRLLAPGLDLPDWCPLPEAQ